MRFSFPTFKQISDQIIETFKRFPLAVISTLIATVLAIFLIDVNGAEYKHFETLIKIIFVCTLGIFIFTAFRLFSKKSLLCLIGIGLVVGYYFSLPGMENPSSIVFQRHIFLFLGFFIAIFWMPYFKSNPSNEQFWEWTQRILFGLLISIILSIVLYAGISVALLAIDKLFSFDIEGKRYAQLVFLVIGLFGVNYFLSQIPKNPSTLKPHVYTKVETIFTKYILGFLVAAYFLILYAYTFKILITLEWPKGFLAWIIIAFCSVAVWTYLFWTPLWSEKTQKLKKFFFIAILLQTVMLGVALNIRVSSYAWTEHRYMIAIFGIWLFFISLYFLLAKQPRYKWLFMSLSLVVLISQVGPLSSYEISKKSQQNRLKSVIENSKPLSQKSDAKIRYEISNMISYLASKHGVESLRSVMPEIVSKYQQEYGLNDDNYKFQTFATSKLGFAYVDRWQYKNKTNEIDKAFSISRREVDSLDVREYDFVVKVGYSKDMRKLAYVKTMPKELEFHFIKNDLEIKEKDTIISNIDLSNFYKKIINDNELRALRYNSDFDTKTDEKLNFVYQDENISVKILFYYIHISLKNEINHVQATVLYRAK